MNIFKSSADPTKISKTVQGFLLVLVPIAMMVTGVSEAELTGVINVITQIVFFGASLIGSLQMLFGIARKFYLGRWSAAD